MANDGPVPESSADEFAERSAEPLVEAPSGSRLKQLVPLLTALVVAVIVFGVVLPRQIDYAEVWAAIKSVPTAWLVVLIASGFVYFVPQGWLMSSVMPGMSLWKGIRSWVASVGIGSTVPALDMVTRFGMYRSWGFATEAALRGIVLTGVFDWTIKFAIPVVAVLLMAAAGVEDLGILLVIALVAAVILAVVLTVVIGVARSEAFTRRLSSWLERVSGSVLSRFGRDPIEGLESRVLEVRDETLALVKRRGLIAYTASICVAAWQYTMLLLAIRAVGVPADVLSPVQVLVVWSMVLLITMIPITPGGVGIAEFAYVTFLVYFAGQEWANDIAAGVALFRLFQFALPIPVGWTVALHWRSQVRRGIVPDPFARGAS